MKKWRAYYSGLWMLLTVPLVSSAQFDVSLSLVAQKNQVSIGEPVLVSMRLTFPAAIDPASVQFPAFKDSTRINDSIDIVSINTAITELIQTIRANLYIAGNRILNWYFLPEVQFQFLLLRQ
jgi:hypothetical protein